jgi:hypothetical protein
MQRLVEAKSAVMAMVKKAWVNQRYTSGVRRWPILLQKSGFEGLIGRPVDLLRRGKTIAFR